jgi:hypothetical protein
MRRYAQTIRATEHPQKHLSIPSATSNATILHSVNNLVRRPIEVRRDANLPTQNVKRHVRCPFGQNPAKDFPVLCLGRTSMCRGAPMEARDQVAAFGGRFLSPLETGAA